MNVLGFLRLSVFGKPTSVVDPAVQFHAEYPLSLPGRLEYLERELNLSRSQILSMAGAPAAFASDPSVRSQSWEDLIAQQKPSQLERLTAVEAAIVDYLEDVGFDMESAAANLAHME